MGLLAGLLIAVPRISPLAAGLPGLALLAWTGLYLFSVRRAVQYIPLKTHPYGPASRPCSSTECWPCSAWS